MELRYIEEFNVEKAIVHIVMPGSSEPVFSEGPITSEEVTEDFLPGHIVKILGDFENMKAEFVRRSSGSTWELVNQILEDDELFVENSKIIAKQAALATMNFEGIPSYGLIIAKLTTLNEGKKVPLIAILKADCHSTYAHNVVFEDEELKVEIVRSENTLPSGSQKVSNCAIIKAFDDTGYQMLVLNKKIRDEEGILVDYFVENFLGADYVMDDTSKTVKIKGMVEKWIRKTSKDEVAKGIESREILDKTIGDGMKVKVDDLVYAITDSNDEKETLQEVLSSGGISPGDEFQVDKRYLDKKMKSKQVKTNTGFTLRADREMFSDKNKFEIRYNGDGTVDYVIKSIRNTIER